MKWRFCILINLFNKKILGGQNSKGCVIKDMSFIADLHIHSKYSMATSRHLTPEHLEYWARLKGINVVGTGDCVHPGWSGELMERLEPADNGLLILKEEFRLDESRALEERGRGGRIFFILTGEISSIYKRDGKTRKVHNIVVLPGFDALLKIQAKLDSAGNIRSDGRPILGIDSRDILEMTLESGPESFLIPAHIWTPWFSVLGSKSGFDSIDECYGTLSQEIFAVETGLSSDPPMNRRCSFLDRYRLTSSSDAHSPEKLGREASVFNRDISYHDIYDALKNDSGYGGTIEYFPDEGKYHLDGHRNCGVRLTPAETKKNHGLCPVCGRGLTLGVQYRVDELADRNTDCVPSPHPHRYLTRLEDILAEIKNVKSASSKQVQIEYFRLTTGLGSEFDILLNIDIAEIKCFAGDMLSEAVKRLRAGRVILDPGYDGEFGRVRLFNPGEVSSTCSGSLFITEGTVPASGDSVSSVKKTIPPKKIKRIDFIERQTIQAEPLPPEFYKEAESLQLDAVRSDSKNTLVAAGPGSGKTRVLIERIARLINEMNVPPEKITAITFSNRAAEEIRARAETRLHGDAPGVYTFHTFGLTVINRYLKEFGRGGDFFIAQKDDIAGLYKKITGKRIAPELIDKIYNFKEGITAEDETDSAFADGLADYEKFLLKLNAFDLPDLVFRPLTYLMNNESALKEVRSRTEWLLIDEAQDINMTQYRLTSLLAAGDRVNTFLIGDPDQSIYGFRGAVDAFSLFARDHDEARTIRLTKSFRCPEPVLSLGEAVLGSGRRMEGPPSSLKVQGVEAVTPAMEAEWIASRIESMLGGVRSFSIYSGKSDGDLHDTELAPSDIAVLCRTSFLFNPIEKAFRDHGIPYRVVDNTPLLQREPFKSAVSKMRETYYVIKSGSTDAEVTLASKILNEESVASIFRTLLMDRKVDTGTIAILESVTHRFGHDYPAFFRFAASALCADDHNPRDRSVSLMTMHAAKGLEFNTVFIAACEDGIVPFTMFGRNDIRQAEENRLLYVAVTRAMRSLILTSSLKRSYKGRTLLHQPGHLLERFPGIEFESLISISKKKDDGQMMLFE
jgi:DNA helicase-2/ATP-dependent DNA helicase PcrA